MMNRIAEREIVTIKFATAVITGRLTVLGLAGQIIPPS